MNFEWDERKRAVNIAKQGLDFIDAASVFDGRPNLTVRSAHHEEERLLTIAELNARMVTTIWTWREKAIRIISARRSRNEERKAYDTHNQ